MAVNFALTDRRSIAPDDPMGRHWVGWDPNLSDDELWEVNRGVWDIKMGAADERFATLSYDGLIRVVAEITGRMQHPYGRNWKWSLEGEVLRPGDPVRDELVGVSLPSQRNPVLYFDTAGLDSMSTADRAAIINRERSTMLATRNPNNWPWDNHAEQVAVTASGGVVREGWSTGVRTGGLEPGDRVFLLRLGEEPRGLIGSGTCGSRIYQGQHWDRNRPDDTANYVQIDWDVLLPVDRALPRSALMQAIPQGGRWAPEGSGTVMSPEVAAKLELMWAQHLGQPTPLPPRTSPRQGWQLDPERRKKVENAAQDRLTAHFENQGWDVKDTRHGNSYDALATRPGERLYLEAKGTETTGGSVIVTRGEVAWARAHPGECVLGVLSNVRFLASGDVDSESGTFEIFNWDPDSGELTARELDWSPPRNGPSTR